MTRVEINAELTKLRFEREKAQREVDNIQACMNELMRKRNELDRQLEVEEAWSVYDAYCWCLWVCRYC
jgi:peptidoglycan hydrolase CwlO-like protein